MEKYNQDKISIRLKKICRNYFREVWEIAIRVILLLICSTVIALIVLYFYSILWNIFCMTYSGKKFIMQHPEAKNVISNILNHNLLDMSIQTTFSAFLISFFIGAICQVFYITRYLFYPRNIITKILFWGMPLTLIVSLYTNGQIELAHWSYTIPLTFVPTLCVFTYSFKFTETLLPELGDVFAKIFHGLKYVWSLTSPQVQ